MTQALEERFLFLLLLLRQPRLRMVYVTSQPINPLDRRVLPVAAAGGHPEPRAVPALPGPGRRLGPRAAHGEAPGPPPADGPDPRPGPRPRAVATWSPTTRTTLERDLAILLGIPMYAADPRLFPLGTKTGCRRVFAEAGVRFPVGAEDLHCATTSAGAARAAEQQPGIRAAMVKLNEGVSGPGNAVVDLEGLPAPGSADERGPLAQRVEAMGSEDTRIEVAPSSPSSPSGAASSRSGSSVTRSAARASSCGSRPWASSSSSRPTTRCSAGPSGQSYLGCRFPADPAYAALITEDAQRSGRCSRRKGSWAGSPSTSSWCGAGRVGGLRHRGQPAQGRHHPPLPHPAVPHRWAVRPRGRRASSRPRGGAPPRGDGPLRGPALRGLRVDDLFDLSPAPACTSTSRGRRAWCST